MKPSLRVPVIVSLLLLMASAVPSAGQLLRQRNHTLKHDGFTREYIVYSPRGARRLEGNRPVVVVLHGGGGTHRGMVRLTRRGFNELADRDGFYVVYPNAVDKTWDFGEGEVSEALETRIDDEGFFKKLLRRLRRDYPIDDERVFATGISRGGQASYFLACKFPGTFRAIAPVTMPLPRFLEDDCEQGPAVGVAILNGTKDPLVPYKGGQIKLFQQERGEVLSTNDTVDLFRKRNGCSDESDSRKLPNLEDDETRVKKTTWTDCEGAPVVLYKIIGGGHTWPSGGQYLPPALVGKVTHDIDGASEIWDFFQQFD